jgi:hypothetical protein
MKKQGRDTTPVGCKNDNDDNNHKSLHVKLKLCKMKETELYSRTQNQNMLDLRLSWQ